MFTKLDKKLNKVIPQCPKCHIDLEFYDGFLGYESLRCPVCYYDTQDGKELYEIK